MKSVLALLFSFLFCVVLAQKVDSLAYNQPYRFDYKKAIVPATLIVGGLTTLEIEKRDAQYMGNKKYAFGSYAEDYIQFSPYVGTAVLSLLGMKSKTDEVNQLAIDTKMALILGISTMALKYASHQIRPDASNYQAFPSGHTATAFAGATILSMEYGENYTWLPYVAYGVATGVGALRLMHHKHYWSDVIFGAGLGILSSKIAYWTHRYKWKTKKQNDIFSGVIYSK